MKFADSSTFSYLKERERLRIVALDRALDAALAAEKPPGVGPFCNLDSYDHAAHFLARHWHLNSDEGPAKAIHKGGPLLAWRLASYFGAISNTRRLALEDLRKLKTRNARRALACFGEIDWQKAPRDVRAAYLYGELIRRGVQ